MPRRTTGSAFPFFGTSDGAGERAALDLDAPFWAQITGTDGEGAYGWSELVPLDAGAWAVPVGDSLVLGRTGTTTLNPGYEVNGSTMVPLGAVVQMWRGFWDGTSQDYRFAMVGDKVLVQMIRDAVPDDHPEFPIGGPTNADVQGFDTVAKEYFATGQALWISCLDELPLRNGDRFWVMLLWTGRWVPCGPPRSAGVRLTGTVDALGLYDAFVREFDDAFLRESDDAACKVFDSNGLGLPIQVHAGADLIGHHSGVCLYRVTCCGEIGSVSQSSQSQSSMSQSFSQSSMSRCGCVPQPCGSCPPFSMSTVYVLEPVVTSSGAACTPFAGSFVLTYVGDCTWTTPSNVDQTDTNGDFGPTWMIRFVGMQLRLFAAGTDVGVVGSMPNGCSGNLVFTFGAWGWGKGSSCTVANGGVVAVPKCACPDGSGSIGGSGSFSGSGSACKQICSKCTVTHCQFGVDLQGFGQVEGSCQSCVVVPTTWTFVIAGATGTLSTLNGVWTVSNSGGGCTWTALGPQPGTLATLFTAGTSTITLDLFPSGVDGGGSATFTATINAQECCNPIDAFFVSGNADGTIQEVITLDPNCIDAANPPDTCQNFNVGRLDLTNIGDCYWQGTVGEPPVTGVLSFDGTAWKLALSVIGRSAVYASTDSSCCGPHTLKLVYTNCSAAPATLFLNPVTPCDNCCTQEARWYCMQSPAAGAPGVACCPPDGAPFPSRVKVTVSLSQFPQCMANGDYVYVVHPEVCPCCYFEQNDDPNNATLPWFFADPGADNWEFKFESYSASCNLGGAPTNPFATSFDCVAGTIHLSLADSGGNMQVDVAGLATGSGSGSGPFVECLQLTPAQLAQYEADGWVLLGGPYVDQGTCIANCGTSSSSGSAVTTACCSNSFLSLLHIDMETSDPAYTCLNGIYPIQWNGVDGWVFSGTAVRCGGQPLTIKLACQVGGADVGGMQLSVTLPDGTYTESACVDPAMCPPGSSCDPIELIFFDFFVGPEFGNPFPGLFTATVTT
jgi:hypothetical protein